MKIRTVSTMLIVILISLTGFAEEMTLDEYLELVKKNHPFFTKEELAVDIEKKLSESLLGAEDWNLSVTPSYSYLGEASAPEYGAQTRFHRVGVEAGLNRALWKTGGQVGLTFSSGYTNSDPLIGPSENFKHGFAVSYLHPLIRNTRGRLDKLNYELSGYTIDLTEVQAIENQEDFLLDVAIRFLDWEYYSEVVKIAKERLALAEEQLERTTKRFKTNLVDKVDVLRAEDAVRISEQTILQLESRWKAKQAELAVLAGTDDIYGKVPSYDLFALVPLPQKEEASTMLKSQSRILQTFEILKKQLYHQRVGLVEQSRARLNLSLTGGLYGSDEKFGKSLGIYKPDATVALVYSRILGNRTVNAQIEKVDIQIRQIEEDMKNIETGLEASMVNLLIQIVEMEKVLALNQAQIRSAEEKTKEELRMYNQGRSQLTFVIQSRDNEENAKLNYTDNAALYHQLLIQYRALLDELLTVE